MTRSPIRRKDGRFWRSGGSPRIHRKTPSSGAALRFAASAFRVSLSLYRFSFAMEARVGICIGQMSMQESDFEQALPKCSAYCRRISPAFSWFRAATR